jgi:transcriptional regulator with XRE-family HTH domain
MAKTPRGNNLRAVRLSLGMSVKVACQRLNVSPITLMQWELGNRKPNRNNWKQLHSVYAASTEQVKWKANKVLPEYILTSNGRKWTRNCDEYIHDPEDVHYILVDSDGNAVVLEYVSHIDDDNFGLGIKLKMK